MVAVLFIFSTVSEALAEPVKESLYALSTVQAPYASELDLPSGDMKKFRDIEVSSEVTPDVYTYELSIAAETPEFYRLSSDYGREYLKNHKDKAYVDLYDELCAQCNAFEGYYDDVSATTVEFIDGSLQKLYYLPMQKGKYYIYGLTIDEIRAVFITFIKDHPEYYWLDTFTYVEEINYFTIDLCIYEEYASGAERQKLDEEIQTNLEKYVSAAEKYRSQSEYITAKKVHDDIAEAVEYSYEYFDKDGIKYSRPSETAAAHNIVSVLDNDEDTMPVCEGYAKAYSLILNALCIENILLTGYAGGDDHAWNLVKLDDDRFYWVDLTWDDPGDEISHYFFARGNTEFNEYHRPDTSQDTGFYFQYDLPEVPDTDFELMPFLNDNIINGIDIIHSGTFGDDLSWELYENKVLYIRGTGDMPQSFEYDNEKHITDAPWYEYQSDIAYVIIGEGITYVSSFAFSACFGIEYAYFPDGLESLGNYVFANAFSLKQIRLPASLISIGRNLVFSSNSMYFSDIYYDGTEDEWNEVSKENADIPTGITMHYSSASAPKQTPSAAPTPTPVTPTATPAVPIDEQYKYAISELKLTNKAGEKIAPIDIHGEANLHIVIDDHDADDREDTVILAIYCPDGRLNTIATQTMQFKATGRHTADFEFNADKGEVGEIKVFIWDSYNHHNPLALMKDLK